MVFLKVYFLYGKRFAAVVLKVDFQDTIGETKYHLSWLKQKLQVQSLIAALFLLSYLHPFFLCY